MLCYTTKEGRVVNKLFNRLLHGVPDTLRSSIFFIHLLPAPHYPFQVSQAEIDASEGDLSAELKAAIQMAKENIEIFHASQKEEPKVHLLLLLLY